MIKEAMEFILGLKKPETLILNGKIYMDGNYSLLKEPTPAPLVTHSLLSIAEYINDAELGDKLVIHIESPVCVKLYSALETQLMQQHTFMIAKYEVPYFSFGQWNNLEQFIINLQAQFLDNEARAQILKVVGNLTDSAVKTMSDDGTTQIVNAKTGLGSVGNAVVPNPVTLIPYRTFPEVDQPEGNFIFRMKQQPQSEPLCGLWDASGDDWKLTALDNIRDFFKAEELALDTNKVLILA